MKFSIYLFCHYLAFLLGNNNNNNNNNTLINLIYLKYIFLILRSQLRRVSVRISVHSHYELQLILQYWSDFQNTRASNNFRQSHSVFQKKIIIQVEINTRHQSQLLNKYLVVLDSINLFEISFCAGNFLSFLAAFKLKKIFIIITEWIS